MKAGGNHHFFKFAFLGRTKALFVQMRQHARQTSLEAGANTKRPAKKRPAAADRDQHGSDEAAADPAPPVRGGDWSGDQPVANA